MAFERGTFGFRMFTLPRPLPEDAVERFAGSALPGLNLQSTQEELTGWVTGRHLLDGQITEGTALYGGYLRLNLLHAIKKVPPTLLQAEYRMEEIAQLAAGDREFLNQKERKEIKDGITSRLLPTMPYQLNAIPMVYEPGADFLYAGALSEKQLDRFAVYFRYAMGFDVLPADPDEIALRTQQIDPRQLHPTSFSPDVPDAMMENPIGQDFLTWLWFRSETSSGTVDVPGEGNLSYMLQGPLTLVFEGSGAHETVLRKGEPLVSAEARTSLLSGKKLRSARLLVARDEQQWQCTLDAEHFSFRSMKLPDDEAMDPIGRFQERMVFLETFRKTFLHLYAQFLTERAESAQWKPVQKKIQSWVKDRPTRK